MEKKKKKEQTGLEERNRHRASARWRDQDWVVPESFEKTISILLSLHFFTFPSGLFSFLVLVFVIPLVRSTARIF